MPANNGTVASDPYLRTNFPSISVCGDVAGPYQFTHVAAHQAWYAAVNALFGTFRKFRVDYSVIPWATYTDPEVASVGLNEKRARVQGVEYRVLEEAFADNDLKILDEAGEEVPEGFEVPTTKGSMLGGGILVLIGVLFILDLNFDVSMAWIEDWWPLILVGLLLLWLAYRPARKQKEV